MIIFYIFIGNDGSPPANLSASFWSHHIRFLISSDPLRAFLSGLDIFSQWHRVTRYLHSLEALGFHCAHAKARFLASLMFKTLICNTTILLPLIVIFHTGWINIGREIYQLSWLLCFRNMDSFFACPCLVSRLVLSGHCFWRIRLWWIWGKGVISFAQGRRQSRGRCSYVE
jgi:hypothetical protein